MGLWASGLVDDCHATMPFFGLECTIIESLEGKVCVYDIQCRSQSNRSRREQRQASKQSEAEHTLSSPYDHRRYTYFRYKEQSKRHR